MSDTVPLLHVKQLSLRFGSRDTGHVVRDIDFSIAKGDMLAVVGESGSGKSLSALACIGLQPAGATVTGSVMFDGQELCGAPEAVMRRVRGQRISMIFQEPMTALNPLHTIEKQIAEMIRLHQDYSESRIKARVVELLEQVGLAHLIARLGAYPHQLSGGERQRVMIAMAIANDPDLLIADEPTTAVDVTVQAKILTLLKKLQKELGMAMLFITHDLTLVRRLADHVAVMQQGHIVEQGTVKEVFAHPTHAYTQMLLSSEPKGSPLPVAEPHKLVMECAHLKMYFPIRTGFFRRVTGHVKAVDDVSVTIPEASTLGVVGESGSGKSTLGFALMRLLQPEGRVVFMGESIEHYSAKQMQPLRKSIQMVFQDPFASLNPRMTVQQIIEEGLLVHHKDMSANERCEAVLNMLDEVGLSREMAQRYPHEFSGGQRQRISVARAMVLHPKFVVMDEPTSALDLTVQSQMIALLKDLQQKYQVSYLFISHDLRVVRAIAHHVLVMRGGKVVEHQQTQALFASPKEDYTRTLIQAAFLDGND